MDNLFLHSFIIAVILNSIFYFIAYKWQTDKFTDMTYSLTFIAISIYGFFNSNQGLVQLINMLLICSWTIRLGSYLMKRIHSMGRDNRFDDIRPYPLKFLGFWIMQTITCFIVSIPAIFINKDLTTEIGFSLYIGITIAVIGLTVESVADYQKYQFKKTKPNQFMNQGLWSRLRHPNYTGEIMFWTGIAIASISISSAWISLISPLWISFILIKFSGIPILDQKWEANYGDSPSFQTYKERSWKLFPLIY